MMQPAIQIDTHRSVKELIGSGIPEAQAEALIAVLAPAVGNPNLVTKDDLEKALAKFATKEDLELAVVKLEAMIKAQDAKFVTKEEFETFKAEVFRRFANLEARQTSLEEKFDHLAEKVDKNTKAIEKMRDENARQLKWQIGFGLALIAIIVGLLMPIIMMLIDINSKIS